VIGERRTAAAGDSLMLMPEPSILDERLAEIDRRLRTIQTELAPAPPVAEAPAQQLLPPPTPLRAAPVPEPADDDDDRVDALIAQLSELSGAHERLLELHRDLLAQYAEVLSHPGAGADGPGSGATAELRVGPFADAVAVRAFTRALASLPGVDEVDVREYLDGGRVVLEARLVGGDRAGA
jgi:hypothetical protein